MEKTKRNWFCQVRDRLVHSKEGLNVRKTAVAILVLGVASLAVLLFLLLNNDIRDPLSASITLVVGLLGVWISIQGAITLIQTQEQAKSAQQALVNLEALNQIMRAQRHDFKNHIQVVSALLDLEEYDEARDYLRSINADLGYVTRALKTSQPSVNALLQAKLLICEKKGILLELDIRAALCELPIKSWEVCRILGNLIDNAIDALEEGKTANPHIVVRIHENKFASRFIVENNGPVIDPHTKEQMFVPEFSTKGENRGMGLSIIRGITDRCDGQINVSSDINCTTFEVYLPHQPDQESLSQSN